MGNRQVVLPDRIVAAPRRSCSYSDLTFIKSADELLVRKSETPRVQHSINRLVN